MKDVKMCPKDATLLSCLSDLEVLLCLILLSSMILFYREIYFKLKKEGGI